MLLSERVRNRRIELGLSQEELAKRMGYSSRTSINKIENGRAVSQKIIVRLAEALQTTPSYLMDWEDEKGYIQGIPKQDKCLIKFYTYFDISKQKLIDSGMYETFKNHQNEYYKWYYALSQKLESIIEFIKESNDFLQSVYVPFYEYDDYFNDYIDDYLSMIKSFYDNLDLLNENLDNLLHEEQNGKTFGNLVNDKDIKNFLKENYFSKHNSDEFEKLSKNELKEIYMEKIEDLKMENERFKKALEIK